MLICSLPSVPWRMSKTKTIFFESGDQWPSKWGVFWPGSRRLEVAAVGVDGPQAHLALVDAREEELLAVGRPLQVLLEGAVPGEADRLRGGGAARAPASSRAGSDGRRLRGFISSPRSSSRVAARFGAPKDPVIVPRPCSPEGATFSAAPRCAYNTSTGTVAGPSRNLRGRAGSPPARLRPHMQDASFTFLKNRPRNAQPLRLRATHPGRGPRLGRAATPTRFAPTATATSSPSVNPERPARASCWPATATRSA